MLNYECIHLCFYFAIVQVKHGMLTLEMDRIPCCTEVHFNNSDIFAGGPGGGVTGPDGSGTGGSHGGEGGADNYKDSPSQAYGSLITPSDFGSGGGNDSSNHPGWGSILLLSSIPGQNGKVKVSNSLYKLS